ncbi:MAG TPA: hypothetical protein DEG69_12195 [Flavobacteriaceae bacterium]|nr:hypothetical protein [Flavobacteriaceae bacterium]
MLWIASQLLFNTNKGRSKSYLIIGTFIGLLGYFISQLGLSGRRVFDISSGIDGSLSTKFVWFTSFFENLDSPIKFLFGHFTTDNIEQYGVKMLDSEWGEIFYNFGIFGVFSLLIFYGNILKTKDKNLLFLLLILLWGITSTILFSYRMSFLFMFLLSNYYSYYLQNRSIKDT